MFCIKKYKCFVLKSINVLLLLYLLLGSLARVENHLIYRSNDVSTVER